MYRNSFQDEPLRRTCQSRIIQLIADGGNTLAGSLAPICIDTNQLTQSYTSEPHHLVERATSSSCSKIILPANTFFSVPFEHALELDEGLIPAVVRSRFAQRGCQLADDARVVVLRSSKSWVIQDRDTTYPVKKCSAALAICGGA